MWRNCQTISGQSLRTNSRKEKLKRSAILRVFMMTFPKPLMKLPNECYTMILHALFNIFRIIYSLPLPPEKVVWLSLCSDGYCLTKIEFLLLPHYLDFKGLTWSPTLDLENTQMARFQSQCNTNSLLIIHIYPHINETPTSLTFPSYIPPILRREYSLYLSSSLLLEQGVGQGGAEAVIMPSF